MRPIGAIAPSEPSTETQSNPDAVEINKVSQDPSTCSSGSNGFRVRGVSEINDAENTDVVSSGMKRKHCTADFVNEGGSCKVIKNFEANSNDADTSNSTCTGKELHQGDEENQESHTETPSFTASDRVRHLNASVENASISSVAEIDTLEENGESTSNDKNRSNTANSDNHESNNDDEPCSSSTGVLVKVKTEPIRTDNSKVDVGTSTSNTVDIKPSLNVIKEEATSSSRESCKYGIRCYRRNPMHRIEEAHPGDHDYKRPNFPMPPAGTPDCPFGDACYRRNPAHFEQFTHPPETDFEHNWKMRLRQRRQQNQNNLNNSNDATSDFGSDMDDYDLEDPFINDEDLDQDYVPSDDNDEEYDECDKAEE